MAACRPVDANTRWCDRLRDATAPVRIDRLESFSHSWCPVTRMRGEDPLLRPPLPPHIRLRPNLTTHAARVDPSLAPRLVALTFAGRMPRTTDAYAAYRGAHANRGQVISLTGRRGAT